MLHDFFSLDELDKLCSKWEKKFPVLQNHRRSLSRAAKGLSESLRKKRNHYWLQTSLAQLEAKAEIANICEYWSLATEEILILALEELNISSDIFQIFLMGKLASFELNLSSDIDIIFLTDRLEQGKTKKVHEYIRVLSELNSHGFCYRVDTDLRPNGRFGPILQSFDQFESYYSNQGQVWERVALVRFRPLIKTKQSQNLELFRKKFCYRKYIDLSLLEEIKEIRDKLQKTLKSSNQNLHLKLAPGGIRDIELYTHSLSIIHGGKYPQLQKLKMTDIWNELLELKILNPQEFEALSPLYWQLRYLENTSQMVLDQQTHELATSDIKDYKNLENSLKKSREIVSDLISIDENRNTAGTQINEEALTTYGFSPSILQEFWPKIRDASVVNKNSKDEEKRKKVLFNFIEIIRSKGLDKDLALQNLYSFIKSTRAKSTFYSLLLKYPLLIEELVYIFSTSSHFSQIINNRPELLDSFLLRKFSDPPKEVDEFLEYLLEKKVINDIYNSNHFIKNLDLLSFINDNSELADSICFELLNYLKTNVASSNIEILCLGKWGGKELGTLSDLDFIFITPEVPTREDHRIAKRFISYITSNHRGGKFYPIDLRLRPNGKAGPLILGQNDFLDYIENKAKIWERQAYLRARFLNTKSFSDKIYEKVIAKDLSQDDWSKLLNIKSQLLKSVGSNSINLKYNHGGLIDIEFCIQHLVLKLKPKDFHTNSMKALSLLSIDSKTKKLLIENYCFLRRIEQLRDLGLSFQKEEINPDSKAFAHAAKLLGTNPSQLHQEILETLLQNQKCIENLLSTFCKF